MTLLTVDEAADIMRCSHRVVRQAIHTGDLQAALIGGRYLIQREALQHWFTKRAADTPSPSAVPRRAAAPPAARRTSSPSRRPDRAGSVTRLRALK